MYINLMLIPTKTNVKTITDMRENALGLLKSVEKGSPTYIFHRSKPKAVLLGIDDFVKIQELIENYLDEEETHTLSQEPRGPGIALKKVLKKYV